MAELVRWNPFREMARLREEMDRLTSALFSETMPEITFARSVWAPVVNIAETDDNYIITAELPGISKDDIKVTYENGILTIQGEKKQEKEEKGKTWHRIEAVYGAFERSFRLPSLIQADKISAEYKEGVLTLTLPKAEEAKPKQITIKVS
ncbi:MAG: Hsp20/alpha crystallin family protein [Blastocatellia bacterium]|nr:Hsp20/alpha crystallin family protein [Blastocatellia bacterium]